MCALHPCRLSVAALHALFSGCQAGERLLPLGVPADHVANAQDEPVRLLLQRVHTRCQRALDLYLGRQLCRKLLLAVLQLRLELCRGGEVGKQLPTRTPNPLNRFSALARGMHAYVHACMHAFMHVYAQETTRTIRRR